MPPVSLRNWIQRARLYLSKKDYLECSIIVASGLTTRLTDAARNGGDNGSDTQNNEEENGSDRISSPSLPPVQFEDIVAENIFVTVVDGRDIIDGATPSTNHFRATEVNIQPSISEVDVTNAATPWLSERNACVALGRILFELFSEGTSCTYLVVPVPDDPIKENAPSLRRLSISSRLDNDEHDCEAEDDIFSFPALKRAFLSSACESSSPTESMRATEHLQGLMLPCSICQLVSDLLDAEEGNAYMPDTALLSLAEAYGDLEHMKSHPGRFLYDHSNPREALDKTCLFSQMDGKLYGRVDELATLMNIVTEVSAPSLGQGDPPFEAAFLGGHSGSGKSSIIRRFVSFACAHKWSLIFCKFDRQVSPMSTLLQAFDAFFGQFLPKQVGGVLVTRREPSLQAVFDRIFQSITTAVDGESFRQLCELLPRFCQLFVSSMQFGHQGNMQNSNSLASFINQTSQATNVSSGTNRLLNLFHILFRAVQGGGRPVLLCTEDLQWADAFTMDIIIQSVGCSSGFSKEERPQAGMLLLGSFRSDEVPEHGVLDKITLLERSQGTAHVTRIPIGSLPLHDINKLLSFKLCLPLRHTRNLASLVWQKTRGNPMHVTEFLRSIIQRDLMTFSVKTRRWTWDDTTIDLQMISEGVVELLTKNLSQLPHTVIEALKVASCFGQMDISIIRLLDSGQFVPNMLKSLESAVAEGILEKAAGIFVFTHDMLQESTYHLIPSDERKLVHKKIGSSIALQDPELDKKAELCTLAVDHMNKYLEGESFLAPAEKALFARLNLAAGKHAMSTKKSNYEQARGYFEAGISLLHDEHWTKQYSLSLELYEWSIVVSFMDGGKLEAVSTRLNCILSNVRSTGDAFNAHILRAKFLASQAQYAEATSGILEILSNNFGESFPQEINAAAVMNEINSLTSMLEGTTKEKILSLPAMTDKTKLQAMKFMDLLNTFSNVASPMLMHLVSCRLTKLTFSFGFCDQYSVAGLVLISHGMTQYSNDNIWLAAKISRIAESLMNENANAHSLRARLSLMVVATQCYVEPAQTAQAKLMDGYNSATLVGDVDNAMNCGLVYGGTSMFISDLMEGQKTLAKFMLQMVKHGRKGILHSAIAYFNAYTALIGHNSCDIGTDIEMKTNKELFELAEQTGNSWLAHQLTVNSMHVLCYFRDYVPCAILAEKYQVAKMAKRTFDFYQCFYTGIAALNLARDTSETKWRAIGEEAVQTMARLAQYSIWNFENKSMLLDAELHYLNKRHRMAELAYQSSIASASDHRFINEEAMACELYGVYLVENKRTHEGLRQLQAAHDKFGQWGSLKKASAVLGYMEVVRRTQDYVV